MLNFFVVPAMLYQQQQKVKTKKRSKNESRKPSKGSASSKTDSPSLRSSATISESLKSYAESPNRSSFPTDTRDSKNEANRQKIGSGIGLESLKPSSEYNRQFLTSTAEDSLIGERMSVIASSGASLTSSFAARLENFKMGDSASHHKPEAEHYKSHSISSASSNHSHRRGSAISATSQFSQKLNKGRKSSWSQLPAASCIEYPPEGLKLEPILFSTRNQEIKQFKAVTDLTILNSDKTIKEHFQNPTFMYHRYEKYLDILSEHHLSDPINFATVREHSLSKFLSRHRISKQEREGDNVLKQEEDIRYYEGLISYVLLQCRTFIRGLIRAESSERNNKGSIITSEELMQSNFINYVRFLAELPSNLSVYPENLDAVSANHYKFKSFFNEISEALYSRKKGDFSDELSSSPRNADLLMQSITKVSYEYILLEKYIIHILVKLNHDFLIERRITKHLFSLYDLNMKLDSNESLKILHFNTYFSCQYAWYLAITIPFVRVIETSVYNEPVISTEDDETYHESMSSSKLDKETFRESDKSLYRNYFKHLDLKDFDLYVNMSRNDLAELQRSIMKKAIAEPESSNGTSKSHIKPPNFEYYGESLSAIASETFHVIHSRDLSFQLTPSNYRVILAEFHRLLKKGGVLEMPIFRSGEEYQQTLPEATKYSFPNPQELMSLDIAASFDLIPHFIETLFNELGNLFGPKCVKFSSVLLTPKNEMNKYLIKHTAMSVYEIFGKIDDFCELYGGGEGVDCKDSDALHYFFYIRAEKS